MSATNKIQQVAADNRINSVCIPVMGSGHGGLGERVALLSLLLSVCEDAKNRQGHRITDLNIIVFQPDEKGKPSLPKSDVKKLLRFSVEMFS